MSASRTIKVVSIVDIGQECATSAIGASDSPRFAYARGKADAGFTPPAPVYLNRSDFYSVFAPRVARLESNLLCSARNVFLFGPFGFVALPDGTLIKESVLRIEGSFLQQNFDQFRSLFPGPQILWSHAPQPVLSLNGYSTNNYFHFLIDNLAQLPWCHEASALKEWPSILSGYPAAAEALLPFVSAARDALGLGAARAAAYDGTMMFCEHIVFPVRSMGATPRKVESLRQLFAAHRSQAAPYRKLFIDRAEGQRRRFSNVSAVNAMALNCGFELVDPGQLALIEQVRLFSEAKIVCGAHGAGLANAAFMQPGGALLELSHTSLLQGPHGELVGALFRDLAAAAGLLYGCVIGDPVGAVSEPLNADFTVDVLQMETALKAMSAVLKS